MTQEEIIQYNKRCAKFLGFDSYEFRGYRMYIFTDNNHRTELDLYYHSDWNWIMEILTKISSLDFGWKITSKYVNIYSHAGDPRGEFDCVFKTNCPENVILDVVKTINQFLIWHSNEKV